MGEAAPKQQYSVEEYLEIEKNSVEKMEYHHGEIFSMAGGSPEHSYISGNIVTALNIALRKNNKPCKTHTSDAKIAVNNYKFLYPDASVVCGKVETFSNMPQGIKNPVLIVEVLSEATANYDRGAKFQAYQSIETLQEFVLISQDQTLIEVYYKPQNAVFWYYQVYKNLSDTIELKSLEIQITLEDVYFGLEFSI